jgi:hypothetical protein
LKSVFGVPVMETMRHVGFEAAPELTGHGLQLP